MQLILFELKCFIEAHSRAPDIFKNPSIVLKLFTCLLNERSSHFRLCSMCSPVIFSIIFESICSLVSEINCHRFSIFKIDAESRRRCLTVLQGMPSFATICPASPCGPLKKISIMYLCLFVMFQMSTSCLQLHQRDTFPHIVSNK